MLEPLTGLELQLKEDTSGTFHQDSLQLLNIALQSLGTAPEYKLKTMFAALCAAAEIIDAVSNKYLQRR